MQAKQYTFSLTKAFFLSPKVKQFTFTADCLPPFDYHPGQFITLHFEKDNIPLKRSYSIANPPMQNNVVEFAASFVEGGPGTELLFNLKKGDTLKVTGPYGRLILKPELPIRYVLVATSTGVTPYRAMLEELKKRLSENSMLKVLLLLGVTTPEEALYEKEFKAFCSMFPQRNGFSLTIKPNRALRVLRRTLSRLCSVCFR